MKIVFLDFDGVLNPTHYMMCLGRMWKESNGEIKSQDDYGHLFFWQNVENLSYILKETKAKIVVSSTWRLSGAKTVLDMFVDRGMIDCANAFYDITPDHAQPQPSGLWLSDARGDEIKAWLDKHSEVDKYVIIDDQNDMLPEQYPYFVKTNHFYGLTKKDADLAIQVLNS